MKKLFILAALVCAPLAACNVHPQTIPTSPAAVSNLTKADEQAINTLELAYKLWRQSVEVGVSAGLIKGPLATKIAGLDNQIYSALQTAEHAYEGANATDFASAIANFNAALGQGYATMGGK